MKKRTLLLAIVLGALTLLAIGVDSKANYMETFAGKCIGGAICGRNESLVIQLGGKMVQKFGIYAHDKIGESTKGKLDVYVNGHRIAKNLDIKKDGQVHAFDVNEEVYTIMILPASDDEVQIEWVKALIVE